MIEILGGLAIIASLVFSYWLGHNIGYWKGWDRCSNGGDR